MASTIEGKGQSSILEPAEGTKIVYATLRPWNEAAKKSMNFLGMGYAKISDHHRRYLRVNRKDSNVSSTSAEVNRRDGRIEQYKRPKFEGHWDLAYHTDPNKNNLAVSLGAGSRDYGKDLGVDLLIGDPASSTEGVVAVQAILRINPLSGLLMIEGVDDDHPVEYELDNEEVFLGAGKRHCLWQRVNRFFLGNLGLELEYARLDDAELDDLRKLRDQVFGWNGLQAPDARLPIFPPPQLHKRLHHNSLLVGNLGAGSYGIVRLAIDITTGDPCAVKSIQINNVAIREETLNEAAVLLKCPGQAGLLQASFVSCDHDNIFQAGQSGDLNHTFMSCQGLDVFYFVTPFASGGDFSTVHLDQDNIRDIVKLLRGPMEGLSYLHDQGYIHCDVTCRNMFIMADGSGVLGDYGKILKEVATKSNRTGPAHTRAPEIDGIGLYDNSADVWSFGFAIMKILFQDLYFWVTFNNNGPQSKAWTEEGLRNLKLLARRSPLHYDVANTVRRMIAYEAHHRPTMEAVLARWSALDLTEAATSADLGNNGPPAKFQKTSENTKAARAAPSLLGREAAAANLSMVDPSTGVTIFHQGQKQNREALGNNMIPSAVFQKDFENGMAARPAPSLLGRAPPAANSSMINFPPDVAIFQHHQKQNRPAPSPLRREAPAANLSMVDPSTGVTIFQQGQKQYREALGNNYPLAMLQQTYENAGVAFFAPSSLGHVPPAANPPMVDPSPGVAIFQQNQKQNRPVPSPLGHAPPNSSMVDPSTGVTIFQQGQKQYREDLSNKDFSDMVQKAFDDAMRTRPAPPPLGRAPPAANPSMVQLAPSVNSSMVQLPPTANRSMVQLPPAANPSVIKPPPATSPSVVESSAELEIIETGPKQNDQAVNTGNGGQGFAGLTEAQRQYLANPKPKTD